eukprot:1160379-Pelagomonas_calceolata.AAC.3
MSPSPAVLAEPPCHATNSIFCQNKDSCPLVVSSHGVGSRILAVTCTSQAARACLKHYEELIRTTCQQQQQQSPLAAPCRVVMGNQSQPQPQPPAQLLQQNQQQVPGKGGPGQGQQAQRHQEEHLGQQQQEQQQGLDQQLQAREDGRKQELQEGLQQHPQQPDLERQGDLAEQKQHKGQEKQGRDAPHQLNQQQQHHHQNQQPEGQQAPVHSEQPPCSSPTHSQGEDGGEDEAPEKRTAAAERRARWRARQGSLGAHSGAGKSPAGAGAKAGRGFDTHKAAGGLDPHKADQTAEAAVPRPASSLSHALPHRASPPSPPHCTHSLLVSHIARAPLPLELPADQRPLPHSFSSPSSAGAMRQAQQQADVAHHQHPHTAEACSSGEQSRTWGAGSAEQSRTGSSLSKAGQMLTCGTQWHAVHAECKATDCRTVGERNRGVRKGASRGRLQCAAAAAPPPPPSPPPPRPPRPWFERSRR